MAAIERAKGNALDRGGKMRGCVSTAVIGPVTTIAQFL